MTLLLSQDALEAETETADLAPARAADPYREHDLLVRRHHLAGMIPGEIAVVLTNHGLRVRNWGITETFVRDRLGLMGLKPHRSRTFYNQTKHTYRPRPAGA
jgi:hypothetical protein